MSEPVPSSRYPIPRSWKKSIAKETRQLLQASLVRLSAGPIPVKAEGFQGTFEIEPSSDLFSRLWFHGDYEPELRELMLSHIDPQRDVIDVGANIGLFSVLFAHHAPRVLAVEPTPRAHSLLVRNLARNGFTEKVIAVPKALSATPGRLTMQTVPGREEYSTVGKLEHRAAIGSSHDEIEVEAVTLDSLVESHGLNPGFIKIDVEGGEGSVLKGALRTLEKHRPVVLAELSESLLRSCGSSVAEVLSLFRGLGYRLTDPSGGEPGGREYGDVLAIPETAA
jgi:FkbM family methyltransferase